VRPQGYNEVVESVAGVVGGDDDGAVQPVVVLRALELTMIARLSRHDTKISSAVDSALGYNNTHTHTHTHTHTRLMALCPGLPG